MNQPTCRKHTMRATVCILLSAHFILNCHPCAAEQTVPPIDFSPAVTAAVYKHASETDLFIYRFSPPGYDPDHDQRPAAVFFFGGGWTGGSPRQFEQQARYLAARGMVTFVADYRVKSRQKTGPDACVADGKSAVRWIRAHAARLGIDPDRIAAGGGSAGGHVAAAAGICDGFDDPTDPQPEISSKPNALLLFNPVYDNGPNGWGHERAKPWFPAISPAHNISADDPPTLVFLGENDALIEVTTAREFQQAMGEAGVRSDLHTYPGQPHGFFNESKNQRCFIDTVLRTDAFLTSLGWLNGTPNRAVLRSLLQASPPQPNLVVVLCDDLGYGDVHCLNPVHGKIATPHADRLAAEGMTFTDAHSASSVCTPTRYGLLTGRHSWRTHLQNGVVTGFAPCLIDPARPTVAGFLRDRGYHTAILGKWHLNFQYQDPDSSALIGRKQVKLAPVGATLPDGPCARGFDYFYGFHHARDMKAVIENDRVIAHADEISMLPRLTSKSVEYIDSRAGSNQPFFLYVPLGSPHTPIVPSEEWQGRSGLGDYGDFVMQTDHALGEILAALDRNKLAENTIVLFSSDNGCSKAADIKGLAAQGHRVSADFRGSKADLWDGGHRVPFLIRWPGQIQPGSTSDQTVCLTDLFATAVDLLVENLPDEAAEDSVSFLPALSGQLIPPGRDGLIHHSVSGHFGYRQGRWKLLLARGSGGWSSPNEREARKANAPGVQLYDMATDPGEQNNVASAHPDVVASLLESLEADVARGRTTAGQPATNDTDRIVLWKSGTPADLPGKNSGNK